MLSGACLNDDERKLIEFVRLLEEKHPEELKHLKCVCVNVRALHSLFNKMQQTIDRA